jgi:toxin FitB
LQRDAKRRNKLAAWLGGTLPDWFGERVLRIDLATAQRWAELIATAGRPLPAIDNLLAATAFHHGLGLVTRNLRDFDFPGLVVHSPWISPSK